MATGMRGHAIAQAIVFIQFNNTWPDYCLIFRRHSCASLGDRALPLKSVLQCGVNPRTRWMKSWRYVQNLLQ